MPEICSHFVDVHVFRRRATPNGPPKEEWLVLKRAPHIRLGGSWQMVSGTVEPGEKAYLAAARELFEETGLRVHARNTVFTFDVIEKDDSGKLRFHYVILDFLAEYVSGELKPASDVKDAKWVSFGDLKSFPTHPLALQALRKSGLWRE